jgi:phosphatidyl-myo-inositol dimannoside synthase
LYCPGMRFLFRRARGIAANSHFTQKLLEGIGCDPRRLRVIHPGVSASEYPEHSTTWRKSVLVKHNLTEKKVLLTVGRLIRRKGVLDFVDNVLPELIRSMPDLVYLVVGDDARQSLVHKEPMSHQIRTCVEHRGLKRHVRLLGAVDDETLRELHYAADLHVLPAVELPGDAEGFGIVLLEAALARTPVVASSTGGIPEAVGSEGGVLVQPGDWQEFSRVIHTLLLDDERRERMGSAGRERVLREFDWPVIVNQYRAFFKTVSAHQAK